MAESKKWTVLSVGGSLLNDGKPNMEMASSLAKIFRKTKLNLGIVCGGGKEARIAAQKARDEGGNEFDADLASVKITHKNAEALRKALGRGSGRKIFINFEKARDASKKQKYIIMGGTIPGITTDADSVLLAEALKSKKLINLSKTAIYTSDPATNPDAKKFNFLTYGELKQLAAKSDERKAGTHFVFDLLACSLIARSKIESHFIDGRNPEEVKNAILGKPHNGTIVR
ncbi:MAG: UMP kinase [Candidatus Micrarchaeota archaeon]